MKTVIDLDPELTEAVAKVLGTTTKKDTVHAALAAAVAEAKRRAQRRARLINSARNLAEFDSVATDRADLYQELRSPAQ